MRTGRRPRRGKRERSETKRRKAGAAIARNHCAKLAVELCCDFLKSRKRRPAEGNASTTDGTSFPRFLVVLRLRCTELTSRGRFSTLVCTMMCDTRASPSFSLSLSLCPLISSFSISPQPAAAYIATLSFLRLHSRSLSFFFFFSLCSASYRSDFISLTFRLRATLYNFNQESLEKIYKILVDLFSRDRNCSTFSEKIRCIK